MVAATAVICLWLASAGAGQTPPLSYRFEPVPRTPAELSKRFTPAQIDILEMLNRRDRAHLLRADPPTPGVLVPVTWNDDPLAYSPFPQTWPAAEAYTKPSSCISRCRPSAPTKGDTSSGGDL